MDPDQQLRNVSLSRSDVLLYLLYLLMNTTGLWLVNVSIAVAGFSSGLQPHDRNLLSAMHQQLQLQKPDDGWGMRSDFHHYSAHYIFSYSALFTELLQLCLWLLCSDLWLIVFMSLRYNRVDTQTLLLGMIFLNISFQTFDKTTMPSLWTSVLASNKRLDIWSSSATQVFIESDMMCSCIIGLMKVLDVAVVGFWAGQWHQFV